MSGSLVRFVSGASGIGYGVNVWPIAPPRTVSGVSQNSIGMVADLPWGRVNEIVTVTTPAEFFAEYYPDVFNGGAKDFASFPAVLALLNKPLFTKGGLKICRIEATGAALSTYDFDDADGTESVTVDAKYKGAYGDDITVAWSANATTPANSDMTVTVGTEHSVLYENVVVAAGLVVTDPGDPYAVVSKHASCVKVPDPVAATALAGGDDGTVAAGDYTGAGKGILQFYGASVDVAVLFCAEVADALKDDINTGLKAYAAEGKGVAVLCTPAAQPSATALTYLSTNTLQSERLEYGWPKVKTTNFFDTNVDEVTVDGNAFAAAAIGNSDPWVSPGGAPGAQYLVGITGLEYEDTSRTTLDLLRAAGVSPWFMSKAHDGAIIAKCITTASSGMKVKQRRLRDYLELSLAGYAELYVEEPLDLDLDEQDLGENTGALVTAYNAFLEAEKQASHIKAYSVDPFSLNTAVGVAAGRWLIHVPVQTYADQDEIVLKTEIGETVTVSS